MFRLRQSLLRAQKALKGILLVEAMVATALFALIFQGTMLLLESAMLMNTITKREQTADYCARALSEYFKLMAYGTMKGSVGGFLNWRAFTASDSSFGVNSFLQSVETGSSPATCTGTTADTLFDMKWRLVPTTTALAANPSCPASTRDCYPSVPGFTMCNVEYIKYRIDVRYRTPNIHGGQTYRVISYQNSVAHNCKLGL